MADDNENVVRFPEKTESEDPPESNVQLASDKLNELLEELLARGLSLDEADALMRTTLTGLVEDTRS